MKMFAVVEDKTQNLVLVGSRETCLAYIRQALNYENHTIWTYKDFIKSLFK